MKNAKSKRADAERATVWYAREMLGCVVTRRAVRTQFQSVDFFAADVVGKRADGTHVYIQATAGEHAAVTARRRKLEAVPWHVTDVVQLVQLRQTEDPANARRKKWFFRVHEYCFNGLDSREWITHDDAVDVPREWFKAWKPEPETVTTTH